MVSQANTSTSSFLDTGFPADFVWGAATAAYQIEGSPTADGKGESIWDRFSHTPGAVLNGDTGDVACDHYRRWPQDVALLAELGVNSYRFSISWPRVVPDGKGRVNQAGLDFYDRLTDALLEAGIRPFVTLYHWDLPQALQDEGGWANRDTASHFASYAQAVAARLGDRVLDWITLNEPAVSAFHGYLTGEHAPGIRNPKAAFNASHTLLRAHGLGMMALRSMVPGCRAGITLNLIPAYPASDRAEDEEATRLFDGHQNRWFLDPVVFGRYPQDVLDALGETAPDIHEGDLAGIKQPLDFLGINYYSRAIIRAGKSNPIFGFDEIQPGGVERTDMGWEVFPEGLQKLLERVHADYQQPGYYITENGAAFPDMVSEDGVVHDPRRLAYLEGHFDAMSRAIGNGVPLKGYFVWSFMDNFEWAQGYTKRFGLIYVDYPTQRRIWKDSARWYQRWLGKS